jgi:hypothetical protein
MFYRRVLVRNQETLFFGKIGFFKRQEIRFFWKNRISQKTKKSDFFLNSDLVELKTNGSNPEGLEFDKFRPESKIYLARLTPPQSKIYR